MLADLQGGPANLQAGRVPFSGLMRERTALALHLSPWGRALLNSAMDRGASRHACRGSGETQLNTQPLATASRTTRSIDP